MTRPRLSAWGPQAWVSGQMTITAHTRQLPGVIACGSRHHKYQLFLLTFPLSADHLASSLMILPLCHRHLLCQMSAHDTMVADHQRPASSFHRSTACIRRVTCTVQGLRRLHPCRRSDQVEFCLSHGLNKVTMFLQTIAADHQ